jgi:predicted permease
MDPAAPVVFDCAPRPPPAAVIHGHTRTNQVAMIKDLRHAFRLLLRSPGFSLVALASLALGIGANTAIFSLVNAVLLRPMPVEAPDRLVSIFQADSVNPGNLPVSHLNFKDLRDGNTTFEDIAAVTFTTVNVQIEGGESRQEGFQLVSGNYFDVMGVRLQLGRGFRPEDDRAPSGQPVIVLSWPFWQNQLGGRADVIGQTLVVNRMPFTVIGVTPRSFTGTFALGAPSAWVPMATHDVTQPAMAWYEERRGLFLFPVGRLKDGVTHEEARANLKALMANLSRQYPVENARRGDAATVPLVESRIDPNGQGQLVRLSRLLLAVVGVVLVIACANLANLLLARATRRRRELAVRLAIGADRGRLLRQLLAESLVLATVGGAMGLVLAQWLVRVLAAMPGLLPVPIDDIGPTLDPRVLGFTAALSIATGIIFGLAPAIHATRTDVVGAIKQESLASGERRGWLRKSLVAAQVALSVISLVAAGWFLRSLNATTDIAPGFETDTVAMLSVNLGREGYDAARGELFYKRMIESAAALPGAVSAAVAESVPLGGTQISRSVYLPSTDTTSRDMRLTQVNYVSPGYFGTTGIPVLAGRDFDSRDSGTTPAVAIVNETMAKQYWPDGNAVGQRFFFFGESATTEVIGIVRDSKINGLAEPATPLVYEPLWQDYRSAASLLVRFERPGADAPASLRRLVAGLDPGLTVLDVQTLRDQVTSTLSGQRSLTGLIGIFGALAIFLAATGIYGVASYWVGHRTREIGLRMALGARPLGVLALVVRQSLAVVLLGVGAGLVAAGAAAVFFGSQIADLLVGVTPTDPGTFVGTVALLLVVAVAACAWPARRASRIDPLLALKQE